jgi:hypothetical protein
MSNDEMPPDSCQYPWLPPRYMFTKQRIPTRWWPLHKLDDIVQTDPDVWLRIQQSTVKLHAEIQCELIQKLVELTNEFDPTLTLRSIPFQSNRNIAHFAPASPVTSDSKTSRGRDLVVPVNKPLLSPRMLSRTRSIARSSSQQRRQTPRSPSRSRDPVVVLPRYWSAQLVYIVGFTTLENFRLVVENYNDETKKVDDTPHPDNMLRKRIYEISRYIDTKLNTIVPKIVVAAVNKRDITF